jgi:hypothetical protein
MKHSWEEKLGQEGLQYVEVSAKLRRIRQPSTLETGELRRFFKEQKAVLSAYPDLGAKRKVKLDAKFVRAYLQANPDFELNEEEMLEMFEEEEFPVLRAEELELHQRIFLDLESDQNKRFQAYGAVASGTTLLRRLFSGAFKKQLGMKKLTLFKMFTAVAQNLEWVGTLLRGKGNLRTARQSEHRIGKLGGHDTETPERTTDSAGDLCGCQSGRWGGPGGPRGLPTVAPSRQ